MGVEPEVVFTLVALARQEGESYDDFISRIIAYGEWAITVKIADIYDNTTPARLELLELPTKERLMRRYFPAMDRLLEAVGA
jgi:polyferredoxin